MKGRLKMRNFKQSYLVVNVEAKNLRGKSKYSFTVEKYVDHLYSFPKSAYSLVIEICKRLWWIL